MRPQADAAHAAAAISAIAVGAPGAAMADGTIADTAPRML
jgi:hypothetical protein